MKIVTITINADTDQEREFTHKLEQSTRSDAKYHLKEHSDGFHFPTLEAVKDYFKKKYRKYADNLKIDIS